MNTPAIKRAAFGAALSLILVGEPTVGASSGLYSPGGIIIFGALYVSFFLLVDALANRYKFNNLQLVALTFALYSVLITGLLHGELQDYAHHPHNDVVTTLIRLQCSLFPLYVFQLLRRLAPGRPAVSLRSAGLLFGGFVLLLTPTHSFGLYKLVQTYQVAPLAAFLFTGLAAWALVIAFLPKKRAALYINDRITQWSWVFVVIGLVPLLAAFLLLLVAMPIVSFIYLKQGSFRRSAVS